MSFFFLSLVICIKSQIWSSIAINTHQSFDPCSDIFFLVLSYTHISIHISFRPILLFPVLMFLLQISQMNGEISHCKTIHYQRVKFILLQRATASFIYHSSPNRHNWSISWDLSREKSKIHPIALFWLADLSLQEWELPSNWKRDWELREKRAFTFSWQHSWCCSMAVTRLPQTALSAGIRGWSIRALYQLLNYLSPPFELPLHYSLYFIPFTPTASPVLMNIP